MRPLLILRNKLVFQPIRYCVLAVLWVVSPVFPVKLFLVGQSSIGATIGCLELYLRRRQMDEISPPNCRHAAVVGKAINDQVINMYGRHIPILRSGFLYWLINSRPFRGSRFVERLPYEQDEYREFNMGHPVLEFTDNEEELGRSLLAEMGIPEEAWFVCFHARDDGYWLQFQPESDYALRTSFRNCSIENFIDAMKFITSLGGYAVRIGAGAEQPLPDVGDSRVIDYATKHWSDFGDIYLLAKCRFLVGCCTGLNLVAHAFRVPTVATNTAPISHAPLCRGDLMIPMIVRSRNSDRVLTFAEILRSQVSNYWLNQDYIGADLYTTQNTSDEILDVVREMYQRVNGTFQAHVDDDRLQAGYLAMVGPQHRSKGSPAIIASSYLRTHRELFPPVDVIA